MVALEPSIKNNDGFYHALEKELVRFFEFNDCATFDSLVIKEG